MKTFLLLVSLWASEELPVSFTTPDSIHEVIIFPQKPNHNESYILLDNVYAQYPEITCDTIDNYLETFPLEFDYYTQRSVKLKHVQQLINNKDNVTDQFLKYIKLQKQGNKQ